MLHVTVRVIAKSVQMQENQWFIKDIGSISCNYIIKSFSDLKFYKVWETSVMKWGKGFLQYGDLIPHI